jgi:hypothetical protein
VPLVWLLPGGVHPTRGVVALPGKLDGLEGYPLVPKLQKAVGFRSSLKTMAVFPFWQRNTMAWPGIRNGWSH